MLALHRWRLLPRRRLTYDKGFCHPTDERRAMPIRTAVCFLVVTLLLAVVGRTEQVTGASTADFRLPDSLGKEHALADLADHELVVVAFLGTECPLAKLYAERLQAIANEYGNRG